MKYALIIGNDQYQDLKLSGLKTPSEDAHELEKVLRDKDIGGFDEVKSLINQTTSDVMKSISEFLSKRLPDDLIIIYFSGHGILDDLGRLCFAFKNTETDFLNATSIPSSFVSDEMSQCRSKRQILILDCCHSGAFPKGAKRGQEKAVTKSTFKGNGYGRVVLTASDATQFALEGEQAISETELSLFTHYLIEGLKTGEADKDNDGYVSLDEWYEYTHSKVSLSTNKQTPQKWAYKQQGKLIIAQTPNQGISLPKWLIQLLENHSQDAKTLAIKELQNLTNSQDTTIRELAINRLREINKFDSSSTLMPKAALPTFLHNDINLKEKSIILPNNQELIHIPAGSFIMGSKSFSDIERPAHTVSIPYNYWISRYPITNILYNQFKKKKYIKFKENHPVVYLTWKDANNFTIWLNQSFSQFIPENYIFRLPTEGEWEKAARSESGNTYPWGNEFSSEKCNSLGSKINDTTPVEYYSPSGDSPYGCSDMVGNVWEWTCSYFKQYPFENSNIIKEITDERLITLRGGSWRSPQNKISTTSRNSSKWNQEWLDLGFRIVLAPSQI